VRNDANCKPYFCVAEKRLSGPSSASRHDSALVAVLFADPKNGEKFLTGGIDFTNPDALNQFLVGNARRLGTAGKILFPIPDRRLSKRLYRLTARTLLVWGNEDKLIPPVYAERWKQLIPRAELARIPAAGHMVPYEQPAAVAAAIQAFLEAK
jgi:pimeloyl-ACP methyl ester carboxylesterase